VCACVCVRKNFLPDDIYLYFLSITFFSLWFISHDSLYSDRELEIFGKDKMSFPQERNIP
jgi:hypothetical protein